ncbi:hypothetical protein PAHAL_1G067200 [Panicum hallii]|nr:hypothetical protein PAHAL_1G067200 [Panicum hallii]
MAANQPSPDEAARNQITPSPPSAVGTTDPLPLRRRLSSSSPVTMIPQSQSSSLQRLHHVEKRIVRVLELAGAVMEELGNSQGPRTDAVGAHCREFMLAMKDIQTTLREEIKSACEYRPFEKCDYSARIANEICCKKLEYVIEKLDTVHQNLEQSNDDV